MTNATASMKPNFNVSVRRQEAEFAGFRCSFRGCNQPAYGPAQKKDKRENYDEDAKSVPRGQGAHIFSSSPNGPRGRGDLTEDKLKGANNCIHVCANCHNLIDSATSVYPVHTLVEMKWLHRTITKVINLHHKVEPRLISSFGAENSERHLFEEFLLDKNPTFDEALGFVPAKPKIDEKTLNAYVNEFFTQKKIIPLEFTQEERQASAKKLEKIYKSHWTSFLPYKKTGLKFSYTLVVIRNNGERIRSGETYRFYRRTSPTISLFQRHHENLAALKHEIGFDISGDSNCGTIEFHIREIKISTNFATTDFMHALSENAKIYYDVEVQEVKDELLDKPFKLNRGELSYRWNVSFNFLSNLKNLYSQCLLARSIAGEFGINFLPSFNDSSSRGGVRPNDIAGLLASELSNTVLHNTFKSLSKGNTEELVKFRSRWNITASDYTSHIECTLRFSTTDKICDLQTYLYLVAEPLDSKLENKIWFLPDNELVCIDYIVEMCKPFPEGEVLQQLKAFTRG